MNIFRKMPALICLAVATGSAAQTVSTPSAVDALAPLAQPLSGTLFFDQKQRDQMDRTRKHGGIMVDHSSGEPAPSVLNGFVKRSDGTSTVWVDGAYKVMNDTNMMGRIQATSVGLDTNAILASDPGGEAKPSGTANARAPGKSRAAVRKPDSGANPLRK
jgi:hypothetical protein